MRRLRAQIEGYRRCVYDLEGALARELTARGALEADCAYLRREAERVGREAQRLEAELRAVTSRRLYRLTESLALALRRLRPGGRGR